MTNHIRWKPGSPNHILWTNTSPRHISWGCPAPTLCDLPGFTPTTQVADGTSATVIISGITSADPFYQVCPCEFYCGTISLPKTGCGNYQLFSAGCGSTHGVTAPFWGLSIVPSGSDFVWAATVQTNGLATAFEGAQWRSPPLPLIGGTYYDARGTFSLTLFSSASVFYGCTFSAATVSATVA